MIKTSSFLILFLLIGCSNKDYTRPNIDIPSNYTKEQNVSYDIQSNWWEIFKDKELEAYINEALENNKDIKYSKLQVDYMLSQFDIAESYLYPQINAQGSLNRQKYSNLAQAQQRGIGSTFNANLAMLSYEIDIWGKVRLANESARASLLASDYAKEATKISISAQVATNYFQLLAQKEQLDILKEQLDILKKIENTTKIKITEGAMIESDIGQYKIQIKSQESAIASLNTQIFNTNNNLSKLLGRNPTILNTKNKIESLNELEIPAGLPSTLLDRRPDILEIEQKLVSAGAQLEIAKKGYFPNISLTTSLGRQSKDFSDLLKGDAGIWSFAPSINLPIFTAGRISSQIESSKIVQEQMLINYQRIIQNAFYEVDNALNSFENAKDLEKLSIKTLEANQKILEATQIKFTEGQIQYQNLLNAKYSFLSSKKSIIDTRLNTTIGAIAICKSLGGGYKK